MGWGKLLTSLSLSFPHLTVPVRLKEIELVKPLAWGLVVGVSASSPKDPRGSSIPCFVLFSSLPLLTLSLLRHPGPWDGSVAGMAITLFCWEIEAVEVGSRVKGRLGGPIDPNEGGRGKE